MYAIKMNRVLIIGCPGSGKTTFAKRLKEKNHLPLYHLDLIWHKADKTHISRDVFDARLDAILAEEKWMIDGHYQRTLEKRLIQCDTVFLFDLPYEICLSGAMNRVGQKRDELPWQETEFDEALKREIERFPFEKRPKVYDLLEKYKHKQTIIFRDRESADAFLNG